MAVILIVEDHAMSRQVLSNLLGYMGHRVLEASDGSAALALARSGRPNLIISDIVMPTMDGVEFLRLLRADASLEKIPVIFYTATYRVPEELKAAIDCGCRIIPKPSDPAIILQNVNELLGLSAPGAPAESPAEGHRYAAQSSELKLATLMDLSFHLVGQRDPETLLNIFCRASREIMRCDHSSLSVMEEGRSRFSFMSDRSESCRISPATGLPLMEILDQVVGRRLTLRRHHPVNDDAPASGRQPCFASLLAIPFATKSRVYGWFCLADKLDYLPFSDADEEMAVALSAQAAIAYENLLLISELRGRGALLESANKELEAFGYSVSHDLRGPLWTISGFARVLHEDYEKVLNKKGNHAVQRILAAAGRMTQLIDDLMNLARAPLIDLKRERVNVSAIVLEIAEKLKETQPEREAAFVIAEGLFADGDSRLLRVALENLLGNAWKFTEKRAAARIEFGLRETEGAPVYFVSDNGAGFDMAQVGKLFRPFQRLHDASEYAGTGIGLATVRRVILRHGGRVWIEGEKDKGTTVYFTVR